MSVEITELVKGSLVNEVQRITLRAETSTENSGTFRLEVGDASIGGGGRSRVSADQDGRYWTSQLSGNSSAEEVRVGWMHYRPRVVINGISCGIRHGDSCAALEYFSFSGRKSFSSRRVSCGRIALIDTPEVG